MATQTKSNETQSSQGQSMARGSHEEGAISRRGAYAGFPFTPAEFFRMNPFSLMRRMTEEFDRAFGEQGGRESEERGWMPAIEVNHKDGNYVVSAELPGVKPDDVKLEIADDAVVIQGERKIKREETKGGVHVTERRYGRFYRAVPLPEGAKTDEARANFENGVLEVTVPTPEQRSKRREIPIQGESKRSSEKPGGTAGRAA